MGQQATKTANQENSSEPFFEYFENLLVEQRQHLEELVSASRNYEHQRQETGASFLPNQDNDDWVGLRPLINGIVQRYEFYYQAKTRLAKQEVFAIFKPSWRSSLEEAFLWIGGWRPSMAFHLLYSKSGLQLEARLAELIQGLSTGDLGDISPVQLSRIDDLQKNTLREEKELSEKMAKHQETVADSSMVELAHEVTELMRNDEASSGEGIERERVESTLKRKENGLVELLQRADDLRLRTLKGVLEILSPIQAVHFLIAALELHLRFHDWGKEKDKKILRTSCGFG